MRTTSDGNGALPRHLDEANLISYLDGELERADHESARAHLDGCWSCRSQLLAIQNCIESFLRARKQILPEELPPSGPAFHQFRRRLSQHQRAPVSARLSLRFGSWLRSWVPDLRLIRTYKKTAVATGLAVIALIAYLFLPINFNPVSADDLLARAGSYEFLNETPSGKVARARIRLDRISLSNKTEKKIAEVDLAEDSLTSSVYVAAHHTSGAIDVKTVAHREELKDVKFFDNDFNKAAADYFVAQGFFPGVSVAAYRRLIAGRGLAGDEGAFTEKRADLYELHHSFTPAHVSGITETVLFVNAQTYAPASISIFAADGSDRIEYRFTRISFERVERTPEIAKLFEAPPSSVVSSSGTATPNTLNPTPESVSSSPLSPSASADLEVEVLRLLHQAGADLGEQVTVSRDVNGPVRVSGIVDSDQRKTEIIAALNPVAANPAVRIEIQTVAEAIAKQKTPGSSRPTTAEGVEIQSTGIAAEPELRAYFEQRTANTDAAVRQFAAGMVSKSGGAMQHLGAMRRLINQFSPEQLSNLTPEARASWLSLLRSHARAFQRQSAAMRHDLKPVFLPSAGDDLPAAPAIRSDEELRRAVQELFSAGVANDQVIRSAFTVTNQGARFTAIGSTQFWNSLKRAEALAAAISRQ